MSKQIGMIVTVVAMLILAGQARANLVTNGGFETGDFTGWTTGGNFEFSVVSSLEVNSGTFSGQFGPVGGIGTLSQTLSTTPGATYNLQFFLASFGDDPSEFFVQWDGTTLEDDIDPDSGGYTEHDFQEVATSSSTDLTFGFLDNPAYIFLDDVSVNPAVATTGVPEPVTATLGLLSLGGLGLATLRRRAR